VGILHGLHGLTLEGLSAGTLVTVAVVGAVALVGLYLIKPRRRPVVVAFAALWSAQAGERRAERWARRLRRWLSLALQLLIFGLILLAAADPRTVVTDAAGRSLVLLIDRSASMSATDEPGTRLGVARERARAEVLGLGPADRALVASFASEVTAESGLETDADRLARAVAAVSPSEEPGDLGLALGFAASVLRGLPHPTVVLYSDGAFADDARRQVRWHASAGDGEGAGRPLLEGIDVRWVPVGRRARNVGISSFAARRIPADPTSVEAALTIENFGATAAEVVVEITAGPERLAVERRRLTVAPGGKIRHVLPDVAAPDARLEARLLTGDDLPLDDRAFAVVPGRKRLRVLRVGPPNLYLDGALLGMGAAVTVHHAVAAAAEATRPRWAGYDAVIFDGVAPAPVPQAGHFLYLDPQGPGSPFPVRGTLAAPAISDTRRTHPLLRQLDLADVNIAEARRLTLSPGDVAVAASFGVPLVIARERPGLRVAALAFDVRRSDLPMRAAFPLLMANTLGWLAGADPQESPTALTGTVARVPVPRGSATVDVQDPAGARATWPVAGEVVEIPIFHAGFYRVAGTTLAANLGDAGESNTAPVASLVLGGKILTPPDPPRGHSHRPLVAWALMAATALLLVEWWSTHRRWTV
jgi:hypothetical protein